MGATSGTTIRRFDRLPRTMPLMIRAALPFGRAPLRDGQTIPRIEAEVRGLTIEAIPLRDYRRVCGFGGEGVPPSWPQVLAGPLHMAILADRAFPLPAPGIVHTHNCIDQHRPLRVGDRVDLHARVEGHRPHPRGVEFDLRTELVRDGECIWEATSTALSMAGRRGGRRDGQRTVSEARAAGASAPAERVALWTVPQDQGRRYSAVSGDRNPIHLYPLTARLFGFQRAIVHGMWSLGRCLAELEADLPDTELRVEAGFRRPIFLPSKVQFLGRALEGAGEGNLDFSLRRAGDDKECLWGRIRTPIPDGRPSLVGATAPSGRPGPAVRPGQGAAWGAPAQGSRPARRVRAGSLLCLLAAALSACGGGSRGADPEDGGADTSFSGADVGSAHDAAPESHTGAEDAGAPPWKPMEGARIGELSFGPPRLWAQPLKDYHALGDKYAPDGNFLRGVQDLAVWQGRMYLGYGDANMKLGSKQRLAIRYFDKWDSTATVDEFQHDEEQIDRYRRLDGELWIPGIDATEGGWLGNVYVHAKDADWVKHRTVHEGVHVHDIARFAGDLYAVGSGSKPEQWKQGTIYAQLWRSKDGGESWESIDKEWNQDEGDARFTNLVATSKRLYVFGYKIDNQGKVYNVPNKVWDGTKAAFLGPNHPLRLALIASAWPLTDAAAVVVGRDLLDGAKPPSKAWLLTAGGAKLLPVFQDETVVDVFRDGKTDEIVVLSHDGSLPGIDFGSFSGKWHLRLTTDAIHFKEIASFHASLRLLCAAFWQGALFFGADSGDVYRATGT